MLPKIRINKRRVEMKKLTFYQTNRIKEKHWSPRKKQEQVDRLSEYENTGLDPEQIVELKERDTAKEPRAVSERSLYATCLSCRQIICNFYRFCPECGQRLKQEEKEDV